MALVKLFCMLFLLYSHECIVLKLNLLICIMLYVPNLILFSRMLQCLTLELNNCFYAKNYCFKLIDN